MAPLLLIVASASSPARVIVDVPFSVLCPDGREQVGEMSIPMVLGTDGFD
jgi:hypothetical protein